MNLKKLTTCVCLMSFASCASSGASSLPVLADAQPSSLYNDFVPIPADRCKPVLDGVFLSWDGARELLIADAVAQAEQKKIVVGLTGERDFYKAQSQQSNWLATWGLPLGFAGGLVAAIASAVAVFAVVK
jgi:hypothetical protein